MFGLVVAILFCGSFASAETFPSYGNAWTAYFSVFSLFSLLFLLQITFFLDVSGWNSSLIFLIQR